MRRPTNRVNPGPIAAWSRLRAGRVLDSLGEAEVLARGLDDRGRMARVAVLMLLCNAVMGDQRRAIESGERGLAIAEADGNLPLQVAATVLLGFAHIGLGDFRGAIDLLRKNAVLVVQGQPVYRRLGQIGLPAVFWRVWLMMALGELGEFPEAIAAGSPRLRLSHIASRWRSGRWAISIVSEAGLPWVSPR